MLGVSQSALEALIFRARRSLAEELENLVTCDRAEFSLTRATAASAGKSAGLLAHLEECESCARVAASEHEAPARLQGPRGAATAVLVDLLQGRAERLGRAGLPTIGARTAAGTAAGVGAAGIATKIAVGLAAVAVAGGAGYEGAKVAQPTPPRCATPGRGRTGRGDIPAADRATPIFIATERPAATPAKAKPVRSKLARAAAKPAKTEAGPGCHPEKGAAPSRRARRRPRRRPRRRSASHPRARGRHPCRRRS